MNQEKENSFISHLEALRKTLLGCVLVTVLLFPVMFPLVPYLLEMLVKWSFPESCGTLHYFAPLEFFVMQLKTALILALAAGYPVNAALIWKFLRPALYPRERGVLLGWVFFSSVLFFLGVVFCIRILLPLVMQFAFSFASESLKPVLGVAEFVHLAGWMMLAFGVMFQTPAAIFLAVRCGVIPADALAAKRPFAVIVILILSAILTPPDVTSQLSLAFPTWLLFEAGLFWARRWEKGKK